VVTARVLVIDNYDSFVGSLYQYLGLLGADPVVIRNDAITPAESRSRGFTHLVLSPGPGRPEHAGVSIGLIHAFAGEIPILGVCLGHQAIGQAFGAQVVAAKTLVHGKTSPVMHRGTGIFAGLPSPLVATRYHSLALDRATLPDLLEVTAETGDGEIMAVRHRRPGPPIDGVQFHPESILTEHGLELIRNFLQGGR
jgi:anthranilate synthase/aminodeoxychorismate synthase-like glutamine amidotransferase